MSVNMMVRFCVLRGECSLPRQRHLELDLGELLGGPADFAQEGQPARV